MPSQSNAAQQLAALRARLVAAEAKITALKALVGSVSPELQAEVDALIAEVTNLESLLP